ncbi:MAG: MarR family winged helix-turn-helix transcriptional regulator [Flavobacteriaceae bacterium]|nr:winged helix-turn-helix transcriptional regulator [Flavobacteriaceae bacterium]
MNKSVFNINQQQQDLSSKIVVGLERVSEAFKVLLWEHAKSIGLSPIQIQILIFVAHHKTKYCNVSHLAQEFNVTKPTVSDAVKVLDAKQLIIKDFSSADNRSYSIVLSEKGKEIVSKTEGFANPIQQQLGKLNTTDLENVYNAVTNLIYGLNKTGHLSVQRMCFACKYYKNNNNSHFCNFLNQQLKTDEIRIDCPEFEESA